MPTPLPLSYANVRYWRANGAAEPQYSVPVRLTDCDDVVYDNQDTLDRLQSRHRGHHGGLAAAVGEDGRLLQVPVTPDVGNGRIMRFVELRQVRAVNDYDGETSRQQGFRSYATEDRYVVAPTVAERMTPSRHLCGRRPNKPEAVYINVENVPAWRTSAGQRASPGALLEEETEDCPGPASCARTTEQDQTSESGKESAELSHEEQNVDADGASRSTVNPDHSETAVQQRKDSDLHETGSTTQLNKETNSECSSSCRVPLSSQSQQRVSPDEAPARPLAQIRLADAYLLRMSPPPPSPQADGRRRAAYSDPVRWVSPVSADRQRHQVAPSPTTTRHGTSGRPNGFRSAGGKESGGGVVKTAAMTCTNEALDEAIQRRNRKCKPSALRRLQAAKAVVGGGGPETVPATFSSFEPIFEGVGVACSLRTRSASLNALAKARGHALNF